MSRRPFACVTLCLCVVAVSPAVAQEQTGTISGTLRDQSGLVLPGVVLTIRSPALLRPATATTDQDGRYDAAGLPPGTYEVAATLPGFAPGRAAGVELLVGQRLRVDLTLVPATLTAEVTVRGAPTLVDAGHVAAYSTIDRPTIDLLPGGRDLLSLLRLAPSVGTGNSPNGIDGAGAWENKILVDGLEVSDPLYAMSGVSLLTGAAQEVQVKASGHNAEFRSGTGGVVNIVTRSGSNQFRGGAGIYAQDSSWQARTHAMLQPYPTDPANPYVQYPLSPWRGWEPWGEVGGPVVRDLAWFFVHYSPSLRTTWTTATFNKTGERRTFETTDRTDEPTWSLSVQPASSLRVRASGLHNLQRTRGSSPVLLANGSSNSNPDYDYGSYGQNYWENTFSATVDYAPASRWTINMTAGSTMYNSRTLGLPDGPTWSFVGSNEQFEEIPATSRFPSGHSNSEQNAWAVRKDLTARRVLNASVSRDLTLWGRHQVKGGMQLERITNDVDNGYLYPTIGLYWDASYWASDGSLNRGKYGYYAVYQYLEIGKVQSNNLGFFVQDDWAVTSRLTVNLGVRADREHIPSYRPENASIHFGFGDKVAPRVGFALDVRGDARWRLFGSAGRFQDVTKLSLPRYEFGASRDFEAFYTLDDWDWTAIQCVPWIGGCPGRLIETWDYWIPWNQAKPQLEALGYNSQLEPNLKQFQSNEVAFGLEHALTPTLTLGARYVHKWIDRALDDVGVSIPGLGTVKFVANPGFGVAQNVMGPAYPSLPKAVRDYDAVELTFRRRLSSGWMVNGSYTWSRVFGNYGGFTDGNVNESSAFNSLYQSFDRYGHEVLGELPSSYPHVLKIQGAYQTRWGTSLGLSFLLRSGTLLQRTLAQRNATVYFDGRGSMGRTPVYSNTDVRLQHAFRVGKRYRATVNVNVMNVFNQATVTGRSGSVWRDSFNMTDAEFFAGFDPYAIATAKKLRPHPSYGLDSSWQTPRTVRVSVGFEF